MPETLLSEVKRCIDKAKRTGDWSDYNHIWLGKPLTRKSKIFNNYRVEDFSEIESTFDNYREGIDWGFATDPMAWSKLHFDRKHMRLYVCDELYLYGHSNSQAFEKIQPKTSKCRIVADSSEPKSISEGKNYGLYIVGAKKGPGSVEHGIKFLQSLEIIIHPRCTNTKIEFDKYRYKEDKLGNVLPEAVDKWNHILDSLRYSLEDDSVGFSGRKTFFA
jgi:phage terminase large subunit